MATIEARGLRQIYDRRNSYQVIALDGVDLNVEKGESIADCLGK